MGIIFCVAVILRGEKILADRGYTRGGGCEEGGEVGRHCGVSAARRRGLVAAGFDLGNHLSIQEVLTINATSKIAKLRVGRAKYSWRARFTQLGGRNIDSFRDVLPTPPRAALPRRKFVENNERSWATHNVKRQSVKVSESHIYDSLATRSILPSACLDS